MNIEIQQMTVIERLQIMETLWDSLQHEKETTPPAWHGSILAERQQQLENGTMRFVSLQALDLLRHKSSKNAEFENITDSKFFRFQLSH